MILKQKSQNRKQAIIREFCIFVFLGDKEEEEEEEEDIAKLLSTVNR